MSYQQQYRPQGFSLLPPVVKNLLIINGIMYLATVALQTRGIDLSSYLGLHYFSASKFSPFQFITYMFMHGSFSHILFNMFALWMFGYTLENVWGSKRFLLYYVITGIGAALIHYAIFFMQIQPVVNEMNAYINNPNLELLNKFIADHQFRISQYSGEIFADFTTFKRDYANLVRNPENKQALVATANFMSEYKQYYLNLPNIIGASGAVYGILLAFGMMFPNTLLYIYFLFPIKAKWFVIIFGIIELYLGFTDSDGNVAHFAHLGGMIFGFFLIKYWKRKGVY
jgi:membrane associated rhomboid family serine protease